MSAALRWVAAGDLFFFTYLVLAAFVIARISASQLCDRAAYEDEGVFIVLVLCIGVIAIVSVGLITVLNRMHGIDIYSLVLAIACAPLGWLMLHVIAAFHYANLFYRRAGPDLGYRGGLNFPETEQPGVWEFLYYALTIGMTAQTSDVAVCSTQMRRATMGHSVVSFFFNTAIIAMAVNAVIATAS